MERAETSFQSLVNLCEKAGWDNGIESLEKVVADNESKQALLFAGNYSQQAKARILAQKIARQNQSIAMLKKYRIEHNL